MRARARRRQRESIHARLREHAQHPAAVDIAVDASLRTPGTSTNPPARVSVSRNASHAALVSALASPSSAALTRSPSINATLPNLSTNALALHDLPTCANASYAAAPAPRAAAPASVASAYARTSSPIAHSACALSA